MRYFKLWRRFVAIGFARMIEYRFNLAVSVLTGLAELALAVLTFLIIYRFTDEVSGWSRAEALMLVGVYKVVEGLIGFQIAPNMQAVSGYIRTGEMDFILLSPISSRFLVSTRTIALPAVFNGVAGLILVAHAGNAAHARWTVAGVLGAGGFMLCGLIALYSVWFLTVTFSFWLVQVEALDTLFYSLFETARYPVSFFQGPMRGLLTFVFPVAFATTFPVQSLLGRSNTALLPAGAALAVLSLVSTHHFWNYAVRHYSSASS